VPKEIKIKKPLKTKHDYGIRLLLAAGPTAITNNLKHMIPISMSI
jgi:hypothetical protein